MAMSYYYTWIHACYELARLCSIPNPAQERIQQNSMPNTDKLDCQIPLCFQPQVGTSRMIWNSIK